jgi:hypothetical protein
MVSLFYFLLHKLNGNVKSSWYCTWYRISFAFTEPPHVDAVPAKAPGKRINEFALPPTLPSITVL